MLCTHTVSILLLLSCFTPILSEHQSKTQNMILKSIAGPLFQYNEPNELDASPLVNQRVPPHFLESHYYEIFGELHVPGAEDAFRPGHVTESDTCHYVRAVPQKLRDMRYMRPTVPFFYQKYTEAYNIPVVGSENVPDEALRRACYVLRFLLADIKQFRHKYFRSYGRVAIMAQNEKLTELPDYAFLDNIYNNYTRGMGAILLSPTSSGAEENVLCYPDDMYVHEDILVKEIALGIYNLAMKNLVKNLDVAVEEMYQSAMASGYWRDTYAEQSKEAYFGEGIQSFFDVNNYSKYPDGFHNRINTRTKLMSYDASLYNLLVRLFPCQNNYLSRCWTKGREIKQELRHDCYGGHMPNIVSL